VSHDLEFLVRYCRRLVWLDGGRVVKDGEPDEVAAAYHAQGGHAAQPAA
jgi:ABC-type polysaccharide/polyol phosphate transport system ATPase subunit